MAATWNISSNTHGRMVTCQKPILITMRTNNIQVSHFKCDFQIRDYTVTNVDGGYIPTELNICAYPDGPPDDDGYTYYTVNFADYCRHYFELSRQVLSATYCPGNDDVNPLNLPMFDINNAFEFYHMWRREFRAKIWPVLLQMQRGRAF